MEGTFRFEINLREFGRARQEFSIDMMFSTPAGDQMTVLLIVTGELTLPRRISCAPEIRSRG